MVQGGKLAHHGMGVRGHRLVRHCDAQFTGDFIGSC